MTKKNAGRSPERSPLEENLAFLIAAVGLPAPIREYPFKGWRFDFAWPDLKLAVECEGGTWISGRHNRGKGYERDCEKYNEAQLAGWVVLRVTTNMCELSDARAINFVARAIRGKAVTGAGPVPDR